MIGDSDHIEWVGLLRSCSALEAYCRRTPPICGPIASPSSCCSTPSSRARCASRRRASRGRCARSRCSAGRGSGGRAERLAGRLHASLDYGQVDEILSDDPHVYLDGIGRQCIQIHAAFYQTYVTYPIESALPAT